MMKPTPGRLVIPMLTICRLGEPEGSALTETYVEPNLDGLTPGTDEYLHRMAATQLFGGLWAKPLSHFNDLGLAAYLEALFANSCSSVIVASPSLERFDRAVEDLPDLVKSRVQIADPEKSQVRELVRRYLLPIANDLAATVDARAAQEKTFEARGKNERLHSSPLQSLAREVYLLAIASMHEASLDSDPARLRQTLDDIRLTELSAESTFRLSMIEGLLNLYEPTSVDALVISPSVEGETVSERIFELLNDSLYLDLSAERHALGIRGRRDLTIKHISRLTKDLSRSRRWRGLLDLAKQAVQLVSPLKLPSLSGLEELVGVTKYSPTIVKLDALKFSGFTHVDTDLQSLKESLTSVAFEVDEAFIQRKIDEDALRMKWTYYTNEELPEFEFPAPAKDLTGSSSSDSQEAT